MSREQIIFRTVGSYPLTATAYDTEGNVADITGPVTISIKDARPDSPTLGQELVAGTPTIVDGALAYACAVSALSSTGYYNITWTGFVGGVAQEWQTPIELVDGFAQLCTLDQVKARLQRGGSPITGQDDRINEAIAALLPKFRNRFRREFMPHVTAARTFEVENRLVSLGAYDLRAADSVVLTLDGVDTTLVAGTDYVLWPMDDLTGTAGWLKLGRSVSLASTHLTEFGYVPLTITGDWGIWASVSDVPEDVNDEAIKTVLSWLSSPAAEVSMMPGGDPRDVGPNIPSTWDIPTPTWLAMQPYNRPLVVV